ncbi:MAG: alpha/beta-type small acid-soluble spore protein [Clostridia bacterium]|nr:alpha/beta-type small acid-soluble spore protein [Clostridia bacterium]
MAKFVQQMLPHSTLDKFKYEIAEELGITPQIENGYWGRLSSRDCGRVGGKIGGNMVKVMIRKAEEALLNAPTK